MKSEITNLEGKWQIIAAEKFNEKTNQWESSNQYVKGMHWEFKVTYTLENKILGTITETTKDAPEDKMAFCYHTDKGLLEAEIDLSPSFEVDKYQLITISDKVIKLRILNEFGCPPPYFGYVLQRC